MTDETRLVSSPVLQRMKTMDVERAHEILDSADAYRLLGERLDMFCAQVKYTAEARWAEVVGQAMHGYGMAGALADESDPDLAAHVATVRRHLGRRNAATGTRKRKNQPKPE